MKKIFFLFAIVAQFSMAQNNPISGEYISVDKTSSGINLMLNNDKTFQLFVFNGTYDVVHDSIIFNESLEAKQKNAFNVKFVSSNSKSKKLKFTLKPSLLNGLSGEYLGVQNKENGEITYASIFDYAEQSDENDQMRDAFLQNEDFSFSFELDKPYAVYLAIEGRDATKIEKYIIQPNANEIIVEDNYSLFDNLKLAGNINPDQSLNVFVDRAPMKFVDKKKKMESEVFVKPDTKTVEKKWTFPGKKDRFNMYADSTSVDTTFAAVEDYSYNESDYKFSVKVETSFEEAIKNLKSKYLVLYYNPKSKDLQKEFDEIIKDYNEVLSYDMYDEYNEEYDKFNFYLTNSKDEKFLKANGITKFPIAIVLDDQKQVLATYTGRYTNLASEVNKYGLADKIETVKKAKQLDDMLTVKNLDNTKLVKLLADDNLNFYKRYLEAPHETYAADFSVDDDYEIRNNIAVDSAASVVVAAKVDADYDYYNGNFTFYKIKTSQASYTQKLKDLYTSFQAKKVIDEEFIGVLLNEISFNNNSQRFFNKDNTISKEDIAKYLAYSITYNGDEAKKVKILNQVATYITELEDKKEGAFEDISKSIMLSSNYKPFQIKAYLDVVSQNDSEIENIVVAVNQLYTNINANQSLFDNLNKEFEDINEIYEKTSDWEDFKKHYADVFVVASQCMLKHKATSKFNEVQKWLDFANKVSKNNEEVIRALYDYNLAIGNSTKANEFKTKLDLLTKK